MIQEDNKTQEELIDETKRKVKKLKSLLKQATSLGCDVRRTIEDEIDYQNLQIERLKTQMTFGSLIGKFWKYCNKHDKRSIEYLYVRNINGDNIIADMFSQFTFARELETHAYNNAERSASCYEICCFTEITKEEFRKAYEDVTKNALNILKEQEK